MTLHYVEKVRLPDEQVLYAGDVTKAMYMPGFMLIISGIASGYYLPGMHKTSYLIGWLNYYATRYLGNMEHAAETIAVGLFLIGLGWIIYAYVIATTTELAVTDRRIIAKFGVYNTQTTEVDRRKIAGVTVEQTIMGKSFNYGRITLRGYSGHISDLPPMSNPFEFQKQVNKHMAGNFG